MRTNSLTHRIIEFTVGTKYLHQFRDTFKEIILEKSTRFNNWDPQKKEIQRKAFQSKKSAKQSRWDVVVILLSMASFTVGFFIGPAGSALSFVGLILTFVTILRRTAVEILIYEKIYRLRTPEDIKFAYVWNTAMNGFTSLTIMPVSIAARYIPYGYTIGLWIVADVVENKDAITIK